MSFILHDNPHPECWIPDHFQAPENSSLPSSLDFILKKKNSFSFLNFALFPLTSHCIASVCFEQCLEMCITSTSCVCLPLYNVSLIVFLNCKSLWIKASAKWINVNVIKLENVDLFLFVILCWLWYTGINKPQQSSFCKLRYLTYMVMSCTIHQFKCLSHK